ncbi:MAG: HPr family phosphocarrier protein [Verrucomicrobia bacterium]|nr:HPr family phosphocarrier protein [Verrucomicrobiota bacterium]
MKQLQKRVKVKNPLGLHARPASVIARLLQKSKSKVLFTFHEETINARSIMSVLMLAANQNAQILITIEGDDAQETMDSLVEAFNNQFGETTNES